MEHGSGGVTLEQLAARLAIAEDAQAVALARLDAVDRDHAASRGGAGAAGTGTNAGGGGGLLVIWCETWTGNPPDADGGLGGAGNGTGVAGSQGSPGKVLVFVRGELKFQSGFGSNAPDFNNLSA